MHCVRLPSHVRATMLYSYVYLCSHAYFYVSIYSHIDRLTCLLIYNDVNPTPVSLHSDSCSCLSFARGIFLFFFAKWMICCGVYDGSVCLIFFFLVWNMIHTRCYGAWNVLLRHALFCRLLLMRSLHRSRTRVVRVNDLGLNPFPCVCVCDYFLCLHARSYWLNFVFFW